MQGGWGKISAHGDVRCGLPSPPVGPVDSGKWYDEAMKLPATRVSGWFGCVIGNGMNGDDVQLFFYNGDGNHLDPKLRLVMSQQELFATFLALGNLIRDRFSGGKVS